MLDWFEGRIAAELRLWDAIDQHRLVPFAYYGIHDGLDLRDIPWRRGRGYDVESLSNLFTGNDAWARLVVKEVARRVDDLARMRALGFCVSVEHARFMARVFRDAGIAATAIWSDTPDDERRRALKDLAERRVNVVFSVDLFNEGVDVPAVDTLLMLRPTDSPTLFLQQLGRGLRRHPSKTAAPSSTSSATIARSSASTGGFERSSGGPAARSRRRSSRVSRSSRRAATWSSTGSRATSSSRASAERYRLAGARRSRSCARSRRGDAAVSLGDFLEQSGLELEDIYAGDKCWSDLCEDAGLAGPAGRAARRVAPARLRSPAARRRPGANRCLSPSAASPR